MPAALVRCDELVRGAAPPSLPYKVDTSRPSLRTNWTRLVPFEVLRPAFPEQTSCNALFYGRDLPAYRPEDRTALVNKEPRTCRPLQRATRRATRAAAKPVPCGKRRDMSN